MLSLKSAVLSGILLLQLTTAVVGYTSLGCWGDAHARAMPFRWTAGGGQGTMTLKGCIDTCKTEGYLYAGTQYGDHCFCGDSYDMYGTKTNCNMDCVGDEPGNGNCGGGWANEIWDTADSDAEAPPPAPPAPYTSLGCWGDANTRAMPFRWTVGGGKGTMTLKACVDTCKIEGYLYAGTQYGDHCFCGDSYDMYGTKTNCNMDCVGDEPGNGDCGGSWANEIWDTAGSDAEAPPPPPPAPYTSLGCWGDANTRAMPFRWTAGGGQGTMTLKGCVDTCKIEGYLYAGTQYGDHCFCGDSYDMYGTKTNCDMDCVGDEPGNGHCGGGWANEIWDTAGSDAVPPPVPEGYVGCYRDDGSRDMDFEVPGSGEPGMTVQKCLDGCKQFGYLYAGAQYGGHCFCANEYGSLGTASNCNMDCEGECGGSWANSVYESGGDGNIRFGRSEGGSECIATGWGDPHIITFDGLKYDVHVQSEMTFLKSKNTDFTIQARLEPVPIGAKPMVTTAIVVKEADATLPKIQVSLAKSADSENAVFIRDECYVQLFVDGVSRDVTTGSGSEDAHVFNYGRLIKVEYPSTNLQLDIEVGYWRGACYFSIDFILMDCRPGDDLIGILGSPDGNKFNDWMNQNGEPLEIPTGASQFFFKPAYDYAIENWCISEETESHFTYEPGSSFSDYENCLDEYNPALEEIVTAAQDNPDSDGSSVCEPFDFGCIIETETLGTEAGEAYLHDPAVIASTEAETIDEAPEVVITVSDEVGPNPSCPVCKSKGWGDPHIVTFDGVTYDVHVIGELTFLKSLTTDFTIQARTEIVENHPKGPAVTTAVVVHEDSTKGLPVIQVSLARPTTGPSVSIANCPVQLFVDGEYRDITTGTDSSGATVQVKSNRIVIEYPSTNLRVDMQVRSWRNTCHFSVDYILSDCRCDETLVGILGQPGDGPYNDWHEHNGTPVEIPSSKRDRRTKKAYDYSLTWCLENSGASHFTYESGNTFDTFDKCNPDQYDDTIDEIIDTADPELIANCTIDGEVDYGCIVECHYFGEEACEEYKDVVENTETADITPPPTSGPTSGPTPDSDLSTSGNDNTFDDTGDEDEETNPTDSENISDAGSKGDPHFKTWKNEHFEYHSQCDLVLAHHPTFADGLGLDVQIRTKLVRFWSYIRSMAIRIGDDILEIQGTADEANTLRYWYNLQFQKETKTVGGFPITMKKGGGRFMKNHYVIDLDSKYPGLTIVITTWKEFVAVDFKNASDEAFCGTVGMLGEFKTGNTLSRDGTIIHDFNEFGDEWQVRPTDEMLFHDVEKPQFPTKCMMPEDPQGERRRRLDESSVTAEQAEAACASLTDPLDRKDCVYDILATQDTTMAGAY